MNEDGEIVEKLKTETLEDGEVEIINGVEIRKPKYNFIT